MAFARNLLWVDCSAGAIVGIVVLGLASWLSWFFGLPYEVLLFTGGANLLYAGYSFSLAVRRQRPMWLIQLLILANLGWAVVCVGLATAFFGSASPFGMIHLVGEGVFVAGLAGLEWTWRNQLLSAT